MKRLILTLTTALLCSLMGAALLLSAPKLLGLLPGAEVPPPLEPQFRPELAVGIGSPLPPAPEGSYGRHSFPFGPQERRWFGLGPAKGGPPGPAVVLLPATPEEARALLAVWEGVARREGFTLIAPVMEASASHHPEADRSYLAAVLAQAGRLYAIDPAQLFLFAQGEGSERALRLAATPPARFHAIALLNPQLEEAPPQGLRPPLRFFASATMDKAAPDGAAAPAALLRTAQTLHAAGFPTELWLAPAEAAPLTRATPALAEAAWHFFAANPP